MNIGMLSLEQSSSDRLKEITDPSITELIAPSAMTINTIEDFFSVYERIKYNISPLASELSHQYLFNQAIELTRGHVALPDGDNITYQDLISDNGIIYENTQLKAKLANAEELYQQSISTISNLNSALYELKIANARQEETIANLNEAVAKLQVST